MEKRYTIKCAVFLIVTKIENNEEYVLLQKRHHTGILDNQYDVSCAGHLEEGETLLQAVCREAEEEIGIRILEKDLTYISIMHANFSENAYILVTFHTSHYLGQPTIQEPDKCSDLRWFQLNQLPKELATTRKIMIENYLSKRTYCEYGFENNKK